MSTKSTKTMTCEFGTIVRLHAFDRCKVGDVLFAINGLSGQVERLGRVTVTGSDEYGRTVRAALDNGEHMTRRGWQSRRLWKLA